MCHRRLAADDEKMHTALKTALHSNRYTWRQNLLQGLPSTSRYQLSEMSHRVWSVETWQVDTSIYMYLNGQMGEEQVRCQTRRRCGGNAVLQTVIKNSRLASRCPFIGLRGSWILNVIIASKTMADLYADHSLWRSHLGIRHNECHTMISITRAGPPGIPVLKTQNSPPPKEKFPKIPVR